MLRSSKKLIALLLTWASCIVPAFATTWVDPGPAVSGQVISAAGLNSRISSLGAVINGNLDNTNIKSGAVIAPGKLDLTQAFPVLRATAQPCFSAGTTGDANWRCALMSDGSIQVGGPGGNPCGLAFFGQTQSKILARNNTNTADVDFSCANFTGSGNTSVLGTLGVTGATTLSSTLHVVGATTLSGTLAVTGAITAPSISITTPITVAQGGTGSTVGWPSGYLITGSSQSGAQYSAIGGNDGLVPIFDTTQAGGSGGGYGLRADRVVDIGACHFRLGLTQGVAYSPDGSNGFVYVNECGGDSVALYSTAGTHACWNMNYAGSSTYFQIALSSLTTGAVYDVFLSGTGGAGITCSTVAWANTSARATAIGYQNGVPVLSTDPTKRYIGSFYVDSAATCHDTPSIRGVYNYYNRIPTQFTWSDNTASWTYAGTTPRVFDGGAIAPAIVLFGGVDGKAPVSVSVGQVWKTSVASHVPYLQVGIGTSSGSLTAYGPAGTQMQTAATVLTTGTMTTSGTYSQNLSLTGVNYFAPMESTDGTSTTFNGGTYGSGQFGGPGLVGTVNM